MKYRIHALNVEEQDQEQGFTALPDRWRAFSPEPRSLAPLEEFAAHIKDDAFTEAMRGSLS